MRWAVEFLLYGDVVVDVLSAAMIQVLLKIEYQQQHQLLQSIYYGFLLNWMIIRIIIIVDVPYYTP